MLLPRQFEIHCRRDAPDCSKRVVRAKSALLALCHGPANTRALPFLKLMIRSPLLSELAAAAALAVGTTTIRYVLH